MRPMIRQFDAYIAAQIKRMPRWLQWPMTIITFFGEPVVIIGLFIVLAIMIYQSRNFVLLASLTAALLGLVINTSAKLFFARIRPDSPYVRKMWPHSYSFPSGHACGAMVMYGYISMLLWYSFGSTIGLLAICIASILIFLIGISRLYLEAHFASDVVVGWLVGLATLMIIWLWVKPVALF